MMLSMLGFTINDAFVKSLDSNIPINQIMAVRGILMTLLIIAIAWKQGVLSKVKMLITPIIALRSGLEVGATMLFLAALAILPFSTIAAILQALPLAVATGGALFLKEPVGWRRWIAILIGFIGVLIIVRPGFDGFQMASMFVVISVLFAAGRDLVTRKLPAELPSLLVSLATAVVICIVGSIISTVTDQWKPMTTNQFLTLCASSCFLFLGYQFIVLAMRTGEIGYVVPYRYTSLVWATLFGYFIFSEVPDKYTVIGASIVISTGLFTLYRELTAGRRTITSTSIPSPGNVWHEKK